MADHLMSSLLTLEAVKGLRRPSPPPPSESDSSLFHCSVFPVVRDDGVRIDCHAKEKRGERD